MKQGWQIKKLSEVCELSAGGDVPKDDISEIKTAKQQIPVYANGEKNLGLYGYTSFAKVTKPSITVSARGTIGFSVKRIESFYPVVRLIVVTPKKFDELDLSYLYYSLKAIDFKHTGTSIPQLTVPMISNYKIPIPPLSEQHHLVKILDEAFATIDKAKANAEQNLKNSKELFEIYLNTIFQQKQKNWEIKKLGEVCEFVRGPFGGSLKKNIFKKDGYAVYEQQHAIYNQFDDIRYFIDEKKFSEMSRFELNPGDLIMSCSGTMGKMAIVPQHIKKGIINQALLKLTPKSKLSVAFLKLWMQSADFQKSLKLYSQGAAIQNVASVKILKEIKISVPDLKEQQSIIKKLDNLSNEANKLVAIYQKKIEDLEELKKSILQKAFNGQLSTTKDIAL